MKLSRIRTVLATIFFMLVTALLLDFTGTLRHYLGWMAQVQFLPALLSLNAVVVVALLLLTLVFGRIYCSVICPLGVFQDVVSWVHGRGKKNRFTHSKAHTVLRWAMLAVMAVAVALGIGSVVALLAPYGTYGRFVNQLLQPLALWANNGLAEIADHYDSYAFASVDVWLKGIGAMAVTCIVIATIAVLAWRNGRTWCNNICPVGTMLGFVARFSWLKVHFDQAKCKNCSLCTKNCKASCIDYKNHSVDYSRCVTCGVCVSKCPFGALHYGHPGKAAATSEQAPAKQEAPASESRRAVLMATAAVGASLAAKAVNKKVDGGLTELADKIEPNRLQPVTPPGSLSAANMAKRCVGCQLCVAQCPNQVLVPSQSLDHFMQPVMSYDRGYCRPECTRCSELCPAGAIQPITAADKSAIQIGHAVWRKKYCVVLTDGVECGNCARHCPAGAIQMVPSDPNDEFSLRIPVVNTERCIGCGACEHLCPARPHSAIYVEGHEKHREI